MTEIIKAIETRYAGCHFRSRLEARWAVFFDQLDIKWQYEPEGFRGWSDEFYLPDFHLTEVGVYVEVKGTDEALHAEGVKLACCIDYESTPLSEAGLLILGEIPRGDGWAYSHSFLDWHKGVQLRPATFQQGWVPRRHDFGYTVKPGAPWPYASDAEGTGYAGAPDFPKEASTVAIEWDEPGFTHRQGHQVWYGLRSKINPAYQAARSARFEHGASGAT